VIAREIAAAPSPPATAASVLPQEFGTLASWLVDVVNVLTGNLDRPGGAMFTPAAVFKYGDMSQKSRKLPYGRLERAVYAVFPIQRRAAGRDARRRDRHRRRRQIRGLVTLSGNPVLSTPDGARLGRALDGLEFMVSIDIYVNETTRHANLILPTTSPLEHENYDLLLYNLATANVAKYSPVTIEPERTRNTIGKFCSRSPRRFMGMPNAGVEAIDDMLLGKMVSQAVGRPGTAAANVTAQAALDRSARSPGRIVSSICSCAREPTGTGSTRVARACRSLGCVQPSTVSTSEHSEPRLPGFARDAERQDRAHPRAAGRGRRTLASLARASNRRARIDRPPAAPLQQLVDAQRAVAREGPERCTLLVHPVDARAADCERVARGSQDGMDQQRAALRPLHERRRVVHPRVVGAELPAADQIRALRLDARASERKRSTSATSSSWVSSILPLGVASKPGRRGSSAPRSIPCSAARSRASDKPSRRASNPSP